MKIKATRPIETVVEVICDGCGQTTTVDKKHGIHEYATLSADWGYYSDHDDESYRYQLCEICFFQVLGYLQEQRRALNLLDGSVLRLDRPTERVRPHLDD